MLAVRRNVDGAGLRDRAGHNVAEDAVAVGVGVAVTYGGDSVGAPGGQVQVLAPFFAIGEKHHVDCAVERAIAACIEQRQAPDRIAHGIVGVDRKHCQPAP